MTLETGDRCPVCDIGRLSERIIKKEEFKYKGHKIFISNYHVFSCNNCDNEFVNLKLRKITEKILITFRSLIDEITSKYITDTPWDKEWDGFLKGVTDK